jgi:hypothetical protein
MFRIPHCLDSLLTDGGRFWALRTGRALLPRNIIFLLLIIISVRGLVNPIQLIGSRTRDLPACNIVPSPLRTLPLSEHLSSELRECWKYSILAASRISWLHVFTRRTLMYCGVFRCACRWICASVPVTTVGTHGLVNYSRGIRLSPPSIRLLGPGVQCGP